MSEPTQEITVAPQQQVALFGTNSPAGVIARATDVSNQLAPIVEKCKLYTMISQRKHVRVEGWSTMLAMLGVFPHVDYSRMISDKPLAYESRVLLKTIDGKVVGAGEAICSAAEKNWAGRDEFAIKSMSQTRATGKAARLSFAWIMSLAGYDPLPAEEITDEMRGAAAPAGRTVSMPKETAQEAETSDGAAEEGGAISKKQYGLIMHKLGEKIPNEEAKMSALKVKLSLDYPETKGDLGKLHWKNMDRMLKWIDTIRNAAS